MSSTPPLSLRDVHVETLACTAERGREGEAIFHWPLGMTLTPQGDLLVANYLGHNIRRIDTKGIVTTFAGTGQQGFQQGAKETAMFSGPSSIAISPRGDLFVTDVLNNCLRKVTKDGDVSVFAGTGQQGFRNGPKETATFFYPFGMSFTAQGHILVLDKGNHSIRMIDVDTNTVTTYAGCGQAGCKDGPKDRAMFNTPYGLCLVPEPPKSSTLRTSAALPRYRLSQSASISPSNINLGTSQKSLIQNHHLAANTTTSHAVQHLELYIADSGNHRIAHIDSTGTVKTAAGVPGVSGFCDGSTATAKFNGPRSILITPHGDLLVSDQGNQRIRIIETNGLVSTFAGSDRPGCLDGPRSNALFSSPSELCLTPSGILYISDFTNNKIRCIKCHMWDTTNASPRRVNHFSLEPLLEDSCPQALSDITLSVTSNRSGLIVSRKTFSSASNNDSNTSFSSNSNSSSSTTSSHIRKRSQNNLSSISNTSQSTSSQGLAEKETENDSQKNARLAIEPPVIMRSWNLHMAVILSRCPRLLEDDTVARLLNAKLSVESICAFVRYVYCDELPELSLPDLCDLDCVLSLCGLTHLSDHIHTMIAEKMDEVSIGVDENTAVVSLIELLGHVARNCASLEPCTPRCSEFFSYPMKTSSSSSSLSNVAAAAVDSSVSHEIGCHVLIDTIVERMRRLRTFVSAHMKLIFDLLKPTADLLVRVMAKLIGEDSLQLSQQTCTYSTLARHPNSCDHFGFFPIQLLALFQAQISDYQSKQPSSANSSASSINLSQQQPETASSAPASDDSISSVMKTSSKSKLMDSFCEIPAHYHSLEAATDFVIKVEGRSLPCHKAILYGRWPYFASAMKVGGFEFHSNTLEMPRDTFTAPLMLALLQYMYSNQVNGIVTEADCLCVLDHSGQFGFVDGDNEPKNGFELLMSHCRRPLAKPLNASNCVSVLQSVLKYGNAHQQYKVRSYVARVLPDIMNDDRLAQELEELGPAETTKILFEQFGRQVASPIRARPQSVALPTHSIYVNTPPYN